MKKDIWKILGIEPTKDEEEIRSAYRTQLVKVNPEDDPEGFKQLREAYDQAVSEALKGEDDSTAADKEAEPKDDVALHIEKAHEIYMDIYSRIDEEKWKQWLRDDIVEELDTTDRVREQFLAFCMSHFEYPGNIWKLFNNTFNFIEERKNLAEMFPDDFLGFIEYRTNVDDFVDYYLIQDRDSLLKKAEELGIDLSVNGSLEDFEPETYDSEYDYYLKELSFLPLRLDRIMMHRYAEFLGDGLDRDAEEEQLAAEAELQSMRNAYEYLKDSAIFHPLELVAVMRILCFDEEYERAARIAEGIVDHEIVEKAGDYTYATALFVLALCKKQLGTRDEELEERIYGLAEEILDRSPDFIKAIQTKGLIEYYRGNYEKASELFIEILDINSRDSEVIMLLRTSSEDAIISYQKELETGELSIKDEMELAWALFRTERTDETLELLKTFTPDEENFYGYNNLYGRCLFNKENYRDAFPYLERWVEMIEGIYKKKEKGEELTKKDEERLTRRAFAYYLYASCSKELKNYEVAEKYYKKAISLAGNNEDLNELFYYQENYGHLLMDQLRYQEAMDVWNSMLERAGHFIPAYVNRQKTAFEMRDAQLVIDDYYNITRDAPDYAGAYVLAARVFDIYGQNEDTLSVFKRADDAGVESDELDAIRAKIFSRNNEFDKAYEIYKRIVENIDEENSDIVKDRDKVDLYADMAILLIHERSGDKRDAYLMEAEEIVKKGQKLDKDNKRLLWILTDIYEWTDRNPEATYKKMYKLFPEDANIYFEFGEYFKRKRNEKNAEKYYRRSLEVDKGHRNANNRLMNIYQYRYNKTENPEDYREAVKFADRQLENEADDYYYIERALLYLDGYELEKAYDDACKAVEINGDNVYAHNAKGLALFRMKKFREARESFDNAIKLEDNDTQNPYINAARCSEALCEFEKALEYLELLKTKYEPSLSVLDDFAHVYHKMRQYEKAEMIYREKIERNMKMKSSTNDPWYDRNIIVDTFRRIESLYLMGDDFNAVKVFVEQQTPFLKQGGYLVVRPTDRFSGGDALRAAEILQELGEYYLLTERVYKKAIYYFRRSMDLLSCVHLSKSERPVLANIHPENTTGDKGELERISKLYVYTAMAYFFMKNKKKCREFSKRGIECIIKGYGSLDSYMSYKPERPLRIRQIVMLTYFQGETEEALKLLSQVKSCAFCYFCNYSDCYDYYLTLARIMEMEKNTDQALEYYKKAFEMSPGDMEVFRAIQVLERE